MPRINNSTEIKHETDLMIKSILHELIKEFGKSRTEAMGMIKKAKVEESLIKDKMGFHESPYNWAISILTTENDYKALEKHFYH